MAASAPEPNPPKPVEISACRLCDMVDWMLASNTVTTNAPKTYEEFEAANQFLHRLGLQKDQKK